MMYLVIGAITLTVLSVVSWWVVDEHEYVSMVIVAVLSTCGAVCVALVLAVAGYEWQASEYKAQIINREYGTHYTAQEVFYADDVIDTIRQIKRQRSENKIDLNISHDEDKTK